MCRLAYHASPPCFSVCSFLFVRFVRLNFMDYIRTSLPRLANPPKFHPCLQRARNSIRKRKSQTLGGVCLPGLSFHFSYPDGPRWNRHGLSLLPQDAAYPQRRRFCGTFDGTDQEDQRLSFGSHEKDGHFHFVSVKGMCFPTFCGAINFLFVNVNLKVRGGFKSGLNPRVCNSSQGRVRFEKS